MELLEWVRLSVLLLRLARGTGGKSRPARSPEVIQEKSRTPSGTVFDIYRHRKRKRGTWVLVPGITVNGRKDSRLTNFAHILAGSGVTCAVPTLKGLAACRWETGDLAALVEVVLTVSGNNGGPVGLIGFSFGGSYCLVAAGRKEAAGHVHRVISFGAYHSMTQLFDEYEEMLDREPRSAGEWENILYCRLALLYGYPDTSPLPPGVRQEMESLLRRYCTDASPQEKQRFYHRYLEELDLSGVIQQAKEPAKSRELSPAGNMDGLICPVTLIHDRSDTVPPPVHAERLFSELQGLPNPQRHCLVITSLLSHVSPARILNIRDAIRFTRAMAPILTH